MAGLFIICGHGAGDSGALGNGFTEAERVRTLGQKIKTLGGNNVILADVNRNWYKDKGINYLTLPDGFQILELHMDSGKNTARGGHVIINGNYEPDKYDIALAEFIGTVLPGRRNAMVLRTDLANAQRAAARGFGYRLLECGFITSTEDIKIFNTKMEDIATGILAAFGIEVNRSGWKKNSIGWWWQNADGSYPVNTWKKIADKWYYFGEKGYMVTGWKKLNDRWYWMDASGVMATGWKLIGNMWYYFNRDGAMLENQWLNDGNKWYWLQKGGCMARNQILTVQGQQYAFLSDGHMAVSDADGHLK